VLAAPLLALALATPAAASCGAGTVAIRGGGFTGSGVVWDAPAHLVLTALHVVEDMPADAILVQPADGPVSRARLVDAEPALDLALLEVAGAPGAAPALGRSASLSRGASVALARGDAGSCTTVEGRVLDASRTFAGSRYLALAAAVSPGASGGPVVDESGALIGIVDLVLLREPGTTLAVPVERAEARFPRGGGRANGQGSSIAYAAARPSAP
jgi:putative serine protease PepD